MYTLILKKLYYNPNLILILKYFLVKKLLDQFNDGYQSFISYELIRYFLIYCFNQRKKSKNNVQNKIFKDNLIYFKR